MIAIPFRLNTFMTLQEILWRKSPPFMYNSARYALRFFGEYEMKLSWCQRLVILALVEY